MMPTITNSAPCDGDWVECGLYVAHMGVTLNQNGIAVNPDYYSGVPQPTISYDLEQMALLTGGHAYFSQDIRETLRKSPSMPPTLTRLPMRPQRRIGITSSPEFASPVIARESNCRFRNATTRCRIRVRLARGRPRSCGLLTRDLPTPPASGWASRGPPPRKGWRRPFASPHRRAECDELQPGPDQGAAGRNDDRRHSRFTRSPAR